MRNVQGIFTRFGLWITGKYMKQTFFVFISSKLSLHFSNLKSAIFESKKYDFGSFFSLYFPLFFIYSFSKTNFQKCKRWLLLEEVYIFSSSSVKPPCKHPYTLTPFYTPLTITPFLPNTLTPCLVSNSEFKDFSTVLFRN